MDMTAWIIVAGLLGLALGWFARLAWAASRPSAKAERDRAELAEATAQVANARAEAAAARTEAADARSEAAAARAETARAEAETERARRDSEAARAAVAESAAAVAAVSADVKKLELERDNALARAEQMIKDQTTMAERFKLLSQEILENQAKSADATAEQRLKATEQLMAPMRETLTEFQNKLTGLEKDRVELTTDLKGQVRLVKETGEMVRNETQKLVAALRKPQARGSWGEHQLKRVVEFAGMTDHVDFLEQESTTVDGDKVRPDLKVLMAGGKFVYVDSKVPLVAFLEAYEATTEEERAKHLKRFARHVKDHVDTLSSKRYWEADKATPDFVVLFIPSESLAGTALEQDPGLIEYAAAKRVVLATPTTLIALLWTVAHAWTQVALAQSAQEISDLGKELYKRLATMGEHFDALGRSLNTSVKSYNKAVSSMESRVLVTARRFRDLKATEQDLRTPMQIEEGPQDLLAPELIEGLGAGETAQVVTMIGREATA
jgi:DNA recombination protein RmuC